MSRIPGKDGQPKEEKEIIPPEQPTAPEPTSELKDGLMRDPNPLATMAGMEEVDSNELPDEPTDESPEPKEDF